MSDSWSLTIMLLLAVLVGACLPVLFQLVLTLGSARRVMNRVGPKLDDTLGEIREAARRINRATTGFEDSVQRARAALDATGDLGETLQAVNRTLKPAVLVGAALGPALAAWVKTIAERYSSSDGGAEPESGEPRVAEAETSKPDQPSTAQGDEG